MNESTIKEDERKKITEVYYPETHNRYIQRRMHDDKREIYQTLKNNHINFLIMTPTFIKMLKWALPAAQT